MVNPKEGMILRLSEYLTNLHSKVKETYNKSKVKIYIICSDNMGCPDCGKQMFEKDNVLECATCGYVKNMNNNISKKSNDNMDKIFDGIGNVAEQVSIQVKKEGA